MWIKPIVGLSAYKIVMIGLWQSQIVADSAIRIFEQFPIVGLVIFTLHYVQKQQREDNKQTREWLEHMLNLQRSSLKEIYEGQNIFLTTIINQIENKQDRMADKIVLLAQQMADRIEMLTQQIAVNTSTVSEIAKVDNIVAELIARLEQK